MRSSGQASRCIRSYGSKCAGSTRIVKQTWSMAASPGGNGSVVVRADVGSCGSDADDDSIVCDHKICLRSRGGGAMADRRGDTRPPTMSDVARLAGVSAQTVSRVLNDYAFIKKDTR